MITLVSYPRSGNTYLRNVLFEVYGIASKTYLTDGHGPDPDWESAPVIKTHHRPGALPENLLQRKIVYLVRDGRDAAVSFAHHRKDIVAPESSFVQNLEEVTYAAEGSHFGGWSKHAEEWLPKADIVIRFEELINEPLAVCERLRSVLDLPQPDPSKLPTFDELKSGTPEYGSGKYTHEGQLADRWFRKGKVGAWKAEMTTQQAELFWHLHGEAMEHLGYTLSGKVGAMELPEVETAQQIHIEATKLEDRFIDGIGRYVRELLSAAQRFPIRGLEVKVIVEDKVLTLEDAMDYLPTERSPGWFELSKRLLRIALPTSAYEWLARVLPRPKAGGSTGQNKTEPIHSALLTLPQNARFLKRLDPARVVTVVHDLTHRLFDSMHEGHNIDLAEEGIEWSAMRNHSFISVSRSTQTDLKRFGYDSSVIYEGVDRRAFYPIPNEHLKTSVRNRYELPIGEFLLSVATLEPRKNLQHLIDAYALLDESMRTKHPLVLTGRKGWRNKLVIPRSCRGQIHFTGFVRDEHLPALYTMARGFCYISLYEGFGLPVLEAMACGCPVVLSDHSSLPEVAGETGIQCDPENLESIVLGIKGLLSADRDTLGRAAMKRSWDFTWRKCWFETAALLAE